MLRTLLPRRSKTLTSIGAACSSMTEKLDSSTNGFGCDAVSESAGPGGGGGGGGGPASTTSNVHEKSCTAALSAVPASRIETCTVCVPAASTPSAKSCCHACDVSAEQLTPCRATIETCVGDRTWASLMNPQS